MRCTVLMMADPDTPLKLENPKNIPSQKRACLAVRGIEAGHQYHEPIF